MFLPFPSLPQVFKQLWVRSWSRFWGWLQIASGTIALGLTQLGALINQPDVKSAIGALALPAYIALGIAILGAITLMARSHPQDA